MASSQSGSVIPVGKTPPPDFGGFVPADKPLTALLGLRYHNCHTPGALCGHEAYIDLIPQIMAECEHGPDSRAGKMERQLKALIRAMRP